MASSAVSAGGLRRRLKALMRGAGRASGAWVADLSDSGAITSLFSRRAGKRRKLASNTKLFTTSAALLKFGPTGALHTSAWAAGTVTNGVLSGNLVLRGGGDPTLDNSELGTLADGVKSAGVTQVTGSTIYDESFFDFNGGVPHTGVSGGLGDALSGLTFPGGAKQAALSLDAALRGRGIATSSQVQSGQLDKTTSTQLASVDSPKMATLIQDTNTPSNNFFAETLLKDIGATYGSEGSTAAGLGVMLPLWAARGAPLAAENGSGLTVRNRASPLSVGTLLTSMLREPGDVPSAFANSLAVAAQSGTLAHRMHRTAAAGRCHAKTGTLAGVSVLSGYCFASGHTKVFSLLMNRVNVSRAHRIQDKMAALIARYGP